jgi:hypothetical protein
MLERIVQETGVMCTETGFHTEYPAEPRFIYTFLSNFRRKPR